MKKGIELIAAERQRQISKEGYSTRHDDSHSERELARGAEAYIHIYVTRSWLCNTGMLNGPKLYKKEPIPDVWPWSNNCWNPQNPLRDLIKAGALIAAEIDRLQRI